MTDFCDRVWDQTAALRSAIHDLPFNRELSAGMLDQRRFAGYVTQDAFYLDQYARILAMAGARGPDGATLRLFAQCALEAVAVEQALHAEYLTRFGVDPATAEPAPYCLSYTSFLLATAYHEPWEVLMAALLPCFWLYWDVGCTIARQTAAGNPYQAWIDTYSDEAFGTAVRAVIAATNQAAAESSDTLVRRMETAFLRSCRYEHLFWDGAYKGLAWPA